MKKSAFNALRELFVMFGAVLCLIAVLGLLGWLLDAKKEGVSSNLEFYPEENVHMNHFE